MSGELNRMAAGLKHRMELQQSLAVATHVQQSLLPHAPPKLYGLDVAGRSRYCDSTGGDYYDFIDASYLPAQPGETPMRRPRRSRPVNFRPTPRDTAAARKKEEAAPPPAARSSPSATSPATASAPPC